MGIGASSAETILTEALVGWCWAQSEIEGTDVDQLETVRAALARLLGSEDDQEEDEGEDEDEGEGEANGSHGSKVRCNLDRMVTVGDAIRGRLLEGRGEELSDGRWMGLYVASLGAGTVPVRSQEVRGRGRGVLGPTVEGVAAYLARVVCAREAQRRTGTGARSGQPGVTTRVVARAVAGLRAQRYVSKYVVGFMRRQGETAATAPLQAALRKSAGEFHAAMLAAPVAHVRHLYRQAVTEARGSAGGSGAAGEVAGAEGVVGQAEDEFLFYEDTLVDGHMGAPRSAFRGLGAAMGADESEEDEDEDEDEGRRPVRGGRGPRTQGVDMAAILASRRQKRQTTKGGDEGGDSDDVSTSDDE